MGNKELLKLMLKDSVGSANYQYDDTFLRLKERLLKDYEGKSLKDIEGSSKISTDYGDVFKITNKENINFNLNDCSFKESLSCNLKLVPGVGINTELKLKEKGFNNINSLKNHDKYSTNALKISKIIEDNTYFEIYDLLTNNKYSKECKGNVLKSASLVDYENFKFMDIETLGLSNCPLILIGVCEIKNNKIISNQYLLEDITQEKAAIFSYLSNIDEDSIHVTYNGASFDIPFIKNRLNYFDLDYNLDLPHLDLIHFARNLWKDTLPNCKLTTVEEEIFDTKRIDDVPGSEIPDYYNTYIKENNIGPLMPIIDHNKQDIISLAYFLMKMYDESI